MSDSIDTGVETPVEPLSGEESANEVIESIESNHAKAQEEGNLTDSPEDGEEVELEDASDEELDDVIESEDASQEDVEAAQEEKIKRMKLKIRGEERELDLGNDDDLALLREMAQKGEGADSKFQEAAKIRKQMEALADMLQTNPLEALKRIGHDPEELAQNYVEKRLEEMQLSPDQKRIKELEDKLASEEKVRKEREEREQKLEQERVEEQYARQFDEDLSAALEKTQLPRSPYVVDRIVNTMAVAMEKHPDVTVAEVVPYVEEMIVNELQEMYKVAPDEVIDKMLGKETLERRRKRRVKRAKKKVESTTEIKATGDAEVKRAQEAAKKQEKPKNSKDFFKNIGSY